MAVNLPANDCLFDSGQASASAAFSCLILSGTTAQEKQAAM